MDNLQNLLSINLLLSAVRLSIPLALAALGATICERSGIINLGIEGMMLLGAFGAVVGSHFTGSAFVGMLSAIMTGAILGLLYGILVIKFDANQSVTGIGLNTLASGLTVVLTRGIWNAEGMSGRVPIVSKFSLPLISKIPWIGVIFKNQSIYFYLTIFLVVFFQWGMYRTKYGLRLRALGEYSKAGSTVGINVKKYQYIAVVLCGMLSALGGSYLSIVHNDRFVNDMVAGRGFMALAATIFGGYTPLGSGLASLIFGYAQAIRINLSLAIPNQFLQMLPYAVTLLLLLLIGLRKKIKRSEKKAAFLPSIDKKDEERKKRYAETN